MMKTAYKYKSILIAIVLLPSIAFSETSRQAEFDLAGLYNPLGISLSVFAYQKNIYNQSKNSLWHGLYYQAGAQALLTPAFSRAGLHVEWMPVAVLQLRAQIDRIYFSGDFGSLLSFNTSDAAFGDDEIEALEGSEQSAYGNRQSIRMTLRAKWNQLVIRNVTDWVDYEFPAAGPYYLEREYELLMAADDSVLSNQFYLLFESNNESCQRFIGPYHERVEVKQSKNKRERVGLTWLQQYKKPVAGFINPRWYFQAGTYLDEPNREDEVYILLGIGGDLNF